VVRKEGRGKGWEGKEGEGIRTPFQNVCVRACTRCRIRPWLTFIRRKAEYGFQSDHRTDEISKKATHDTNNNIFATIYDFQRQQLR